MWVDCEIEDYVFSRSSSSELFIDCRASQPDAITFEEEKLLFFFWDSFGTIFFFFHLVSSSIPSSCATLWCHLFSDVTKQKVSSHTIFRAVLESFFLFEQFQFYNMGLSRTLFVYFYSFSLHNSITNWKCVDIVLGIWTQGRRMVGTDGSTELWLYHSYFIFCDKKLHVAGYPTRMTLKKVIIVAVP